MAEHRAPARRRRIALWALAALFCLSALAVVGVARMVHMPGRSHEGAIPSLTPEQAARAGILARDVGVLAGEVGERNTRRPDKLELAASYIETSLRAEGYALAEQAWEVDGVRVRNVEAVLPGTELPEELIVVGAHYDTNPGTPGADDNASAVAALLELARMFADSPGRRTIRFVAFANEEMPYFRTADMGSLRYATRSREKGEDIVAMVCLESLGHYSEAPGSQHYPFPFALLYPTTGDFVAFIGNSDSRALTRQVIRSFRRAAYLPSEGLAGPEAIPGIGLSDHWSFWQQGYPAVMVTDTAPFRNPNYHQPTDTPETLDYDRMLLAVEGIHAAIEALAVR